MGKQTASRYGASALALLFVLILVGGCGGGSGSASETAVSPHAVGGASAAFLHPHSPTNKYVRFGLEAAPQERKAASRVLARNLFAREHGDFVSQCRTLTRGMSNKVLHGEVVPPKYRTCSGVLQKLAEPLASSAAARKDALDGEIAALRVEGARGYALFHGSDGHNYAMEMAKEGNEWKVAAVLTIALT